MSVIGEREVGPVGLDAERGVRGMRNSGRVHVRALNAQQTLTRPQLGCLMLLMVAIAAFAWRFPSATGQLARLMFLFVFGAVIIWRGAALLLAQSPPAVAPLPWTELPTYTVIAPLRGEAAMLPALLRALERLDYPRDRLQVVLALEWDDGPTLAAANALALPAHVERLVVPLGHPRTKPRACTAALAIARGEHVVVYDAEDQPDPEQLKEAAARFRAAPADVACFQAPLRVPLRGSFTMRQFALEYAALFELLLPAMARLGAPFPLGGTSNHFRTALLRAVGGWDAWNVTEDADVGFRLAAAGYRSGMLRSPTVEEPPHGLAEWLPQRTRWLKGYMQTWCVHMRRPGQGGLGWFVSVQASIGVSILSAMVHAPTAVLIGASVLAATTPWGDQVSLPDLMLFGGGWGVAALSMSTGARRAGVRARLSDALLAPVYWSLQSVAFWRALVQLVRRPHHWDKTPHHPPVEDALTESMDDVGGGRLNRAT